MSQAYSRVRVLWTVDMLLTLRNMHAHALRSTKALCHFARSNLCALKPSRHVLNVHLSSAMRVRVLRNADYRTISSVDLRAGMLLLQLLMLHTRTHDAQLRSSLVVRCETFFPHISLSRCIAQCTQTMFRCEKSESQAFTITTTQPTAQRRNNDIFVYI